MTADLSSAFSVLERSCRSVGRRVFRGPQTDETHICDLPISQNSNNTAPVCRSGVDTGLHLTSLTSRLRYSSLPADTERWRRLYTGMQVARREVDTSKTISCPIAVEDARRELLRLVDRFAGGRHCAGDAPRAGRLVAGRLVRQSVAVHAHLRLLYRRIAATPGAKLLRRGQVPFAIAPCARCKLNLHVVLIL